MCLKTDLILTHTLAQRRQFLLHSLPLQTFSFSYLLSQKPVVSLVSCLCSQHIDVLLLSHLLLLLLSPFLLLEKLSFDLKFLSLSVNSNLLNLLVLLLLIYLLSEHLSIVNLDHSLVLLLIVCKLVQLVLNEPESLIFIILNYSSFVLLGFSEIREMLLEDLHLSFICSVESVLIPSSLNSLTIHMFLSLFEGDLLPMVTRPPLHRPHWSS